MKVMKRTNVQQDDDEWLKEQLRVSQSKMKK